MKESIIIRNVGPIKDVFIEDIKPFTILIGESASGKSTMMKIIVLMRYIYKMLNIRWYLKNAGISKSPFRLKIETLLQDDLSIYLRNNRMSFIRYEVSIDKHTYAIEYSNGTLITSEVTDIPNEHLFFLKESWISETRNVIPAWISNAISNRKAELGFYFHETLTDFDQATDVIQELDLDYVGMTFRVMRQKGRKRFFISPKDGSYEPTELKYASSGIQTSVPLTLLTHYFSHEFSFKEAGRRSILGYLYEQDRLSDYRPEMEVMDMQKRVQLHIEEPELSLFPSAQCNMIDEIVKTAFQNKASDRSLNLMMATHSPYIVNYLNVVLHQRKEGRARLGGEQIGAYRIYDGRIQNLVVKTEHGEWLINTTDMTEQMKAIVEEYRTLKG